MQDKSSSKEDKSNITPSQIKIKSLRMEKLSSALKENIKRRKQVAKTKLESEK